MFAMTTLNDQLANSNTAFQLKGSLFTFTVLHLLKPDLAILSEQLAQAIKQAPKFFLRMPIVLDLQKVSTDATSIDFAALLTCLREQGLVPIGIRGGNTQQQTAALQANLAVLPNTKSEPLEIKKPQASKTSPTKPQSTPPTTTASKVITQPVRSGQQIYARNSDLIVLAPVSPGAELIADGHIHVYGALRGRALAGVSGNQHAQIFCQSLEAELVAIAGHYWVNEDLQNSPHKEGVHIFLENDRLQISTL
jgi:septum site-determining protein MinC